MQSIDERVRSILEENGINRPPVDIYGIIERLGIRLFELELDDDVSGVLDMREPKTPRIVVNKNHHPNRKRFSAAHELSHFVLHTKSGLHMDKQSFFRSAESSKGVFSIEIEANRMAAELLMPKHFLTKSLSYFEDLIDNENDIIEDLSREYSVSVTAMSIKTHSVLEEMGFTSF